MQTVSALAVARMISEAQQQGVELVTVTVLTGEAGGTRYVSHAAGSIEGTVNPELDVRARALADRSWQSRSTACDDALFAELHAVAEPLLIFGAGHIAVPLANFAHEIGFDVTVLDDREEFAQQVRFAHGVQVLQLDLARPLENATLNAQTFVVLLTRAHKHDFDLLRVVLQQQVLPRYIGMIGSKRRVRAAFKALLQSGIARDLIAHIHAPVGLEIGAETPAEIAVSIAAELIRVRRNQPASTSMSDDARVLERLIPEAATQ